MKGLLQSVLAYLIWGCFPLYFYLLKHVAPLEVLSFRIIFACALSFLLIGYFGEIRQFFTHFKNKKTILMTMLSSFLITVNWFVFIWAVSVGKVIESSLGYFMTPLVSLLLGAVILKEKLTRYQFIAGVLAVMAVLVELVLLGKVPWVSIILATSFGLYGLVRKQQTLESLHGLTLETFWAFPIAVCVLLLIQYNSGTVLNYDLPTYALLALSGAVTATPLLLFASSVRKLNLVVAGFLMYLNPSMQFVTAIFIFGETAPVQRYVTFGIVWLAMVFFIFGMVKSYRNRPVD
ncbi:EamA family transporter RarD [Reinekea marina]|uniref:EamA family transporter RarD n=1 Tax=Reinekea marina TaxID=1310421 RepID=A0ABV7WVS2_9GAMM|nr:EamA family transporter RarD [Reinekea marina]MDN3649083.1 EamA family transporter RarD [Reinekea marina]